MFVMYHIEIILLQAKCFREERKRTSIHTTMNQLKIIYKVYIYIYMCILLSFVQSMSSCIKSVYIYI